MRHKAVLLLSLAAAVFFAGCADNTMPSDNAGLLGGRMAGSTRMLGQASYELAFASAREVMSQYFPLASSDPDTGVIEAQPQMLDKSSNDRLLGRSPARQTARMKVRNVGGTIYADLAVAVQRQGEDIYKQRRMDTGENYSSVPNQTPAYNEAATTPEQNEVWRTQSHDHRMENEILEEVYRQLHPSGAETPPAPTTQPATSRPMIVPPAAVRPATQPATVAPAMQPATAPASK